MTARRFVLWLGSVAFAIPSATAGAQEREPLKQPATVPVELAVALSSSGGFGPGGEPQFLVGELPGWVKSRMYVPAGAQVVGSAFLGSNVVSVLKIPSTSDSLMSDVERALLKLGWSQAPMPYMGGGFRPAAMASSSPMRRPTFCREGQSLLPMLTRQQGTATMLVYRLVASPGGYSICNALAQSGTEMRRSPFPTLYNPQGADAMMTNRDCSMTRSGGSSTTQTELNTSMSAQAILEHYGRQLQDSGWAPATLAPPITGLSWMRKDSTGANQLLSLIVQTSAQDASCRTVRLEVQGRRPQ